MTKTIKTILLLIIITFSFQVFIPNTFAQGEDRESLEFTPQVPIPGEDSPFKQGKEDIPVGQYGQETDEDGNVIQKVYSNLLPRYIQAIYNYGIGIAAFLALAMIVAGGIIWLTSGGSTEKISTARSMIVSAIIGLLLLLGTYTLLQIVSPALLNFKPIETEFITALQLGCCEIDENSEEGTIAKNTSNKECDRIDGKEEKSADFTPGASATYDGKQCLINGCCVISTSRSLNTGTLSQARINSTSCSETNSINCEMIYNKTQGTTSWDFDTKNCSEVLEEYDCNPTDCSGKDDGNDCPNNIDYCTCYDETAFYGEGLKGEPCASSGGTCYEPDNGYQTLDGQCNHNTDFWNDSTKFAHGGGRDCEDDLVCCYYNPH